MAEVQKRQVAFKVSIKEINEGSYIKQEGWQPNYILTRDGRNISRINLIATIISIQSNSPTQMNITIDDGTGSLNIRTFEDTNIVKDLEIGDIINVIGRPREFSDIKYIVPEVIKKVKDNKWIEVRQKELVLFKTKNKISDDEVVQQPKQPAESEVKKDKSTETIEKEIPDEKEEIIESSKEEIVSDKAEEEVKNINPKQRVYQTIKKLDKGEGVDIDDVIIFSKVEECEDVIKMLLQEGEIFEIKKGKLKVLE